jgi:hypothetical protein
MDTSIYLQTAHRISAPQRCRVPSLAGDLGVNDATLRQALHERGLLTIGIPKTVEPMNPTPTPEEIAPSSPRWAYAVSAPRTKCSWLASVAIVVQSWQATSPVYSLAVPARCVTKACGARSYNKG